MGMIESLVRMIFGGGRNVVTETAEVFRENAESGAGRAAAVQLQAMRQYGAEFGASRAGWFDRLIDGLNRLPRPFLALGTLALFVSAMVAPLWFAERMQGIALVPEPLWWLLGVIVSFYFGARHQVKAQQFQREIIASMAHVPQVMDNVGALRAMRADSPGAAETGPDSALTLAAVTPENNPALEAWRTERAA